MKPVLYMVLVSCLLALAIGCGGNTPGQHPQADSSDDARVQRDLVEDPVADVDDASNGSMNDSVNDGVNDDASDAPESDAPDDTNTEPDSTAIGPVDCESLTNCVVGTTGWCEGNFWATCGLVEDTCEEVVTDCGRGFTCASLTAECFDGRPGGDRCEGAVPISPGSFSLTSVSYRNRYDEYDGNCEFHMNVWGPDRVFVLSPPAETIWTVSVQGQPQVDVVLALVSSCNNVVNSCEQYADEGRDGAAETVTAEGGESGATWYLIVDGWGTWDYGPFILTISDV